MTYTHGHHESVLAVHRWRTPENSAAYLLEELRPGMDLLDVGCGPGTITAGLAERVFPGRVVGIDQSESVITEARSSIRRETEIDLTFEVGDVYRLPFSDATFDVVHAHQLLQHVSDPVAALREMKRVCRSGGIVAVRDADYGAMTWYPEISELESWRDLYRRIARQNGGDPDAARSLLAWADQSGFRSVEPSASVWCFAKQADRDWWGGQWAQRVTTSALAEQAISDGFARQADLEQLAAGWRRWASAPSAWFAVLHGEVICRV